MRFALGSTGGSDARLGTDNTEFLSSGVAALTLLFPALIGAGRRRGLSSGSVASFSGIGGRLAQQAQLQVLVVVLKDLVLPLERSAAVLLTRM